MMETSQNKVAKTPPFTGSPSSFLARIPFLSRLSTFGSWWPLLTLAALVIGLAARVEVSLLDRFCFDSYAMMRGLNESLLQYRRITGGWQFNHVVGSWLEHRLVAGKLPICLVFPLISSLAMFLVVWWGLRRYWRSSIGISFFALLFLAFNAHSLHLVRYISAYAITLLTTSCLFFLFLHLGTVGKLPAKRWAMITLCILPAALFSNMTVVIPIATGAFCVVLFRLFQAPDRRNLKYAWRSLLEMWPLLIFPLMILAMHTIFPYRLHNPVRPDWAWQHFSRSPYAGSLLGAGQFALNNTHELLKGALLPTSVFPSLSWRLAKPGIMVTLVLAATIPIVVQLARRKLDHKIGFVLLFVGVTYASILMGGLLGLFAFGNFRYADYLLTPVATLVGYSIWVVLKWILDKEIIVKRDAKATPVLIAVMVFLCGTYVIFDQYQSHLRINARNAAALEEIQGTKAERTLLSCYSPVIGVKLPDLRKKVHLMDWRETSYGHTTKTMMLPEVLETLTRDDKSTLVNSVLVIASHPNLFPAEHASWSDFLNTHYDKVRSIEAPNIWAAFYRKQDP